MTEKIIIAGAGGQGIMLLGKILAEAAMRENRFVTWLPAYGAEVRGGTAYCMVIISDEEIGSASISIADSLIVMNAPSYARFKPRLKTRGLLVGNSSLVKHNLAVQSQVLWYPFTDIAMKLGNVKVANMAALGCFIARRPVVEVKNIARVIEEIAPAHKKDLIEINKRALAAGIALVGKKNKKSGEKNG
ncbi:MAG: 2-oxoacid:acceptor oxidoreductase family protein [Candidatus Omnitrophota bacterium]|jgi:2-oxoglutarate ferredoxin oxidoreductase subunit gamma